MTKAAAAPANARAKRIAAHAERVAELEAERDAAREAKKEEATPQKKRARKAVAA